MCFIKYKGVIAGLRFGLLTGLPVGLRIGLFFALFLGLLLGLAGVLTFRVITPTVKRRTFPNQGIKASQHNALLRGLIAGLTAGLTAGPSFGLSLGLSFGLIFCLFFCLAGGMIGGGIACIQHLSLRILMMYWKYAPWNYARFLNYATDDLLVLQRVGGGYRFIHGLLREKFAERWTSVS